VYAFKQCYTCVSYMHTSHVLTLLHAHRSKGSRMQLLCVLKLINERYYSISGNFCIALTVKLVILYKLFPQLNLLFQNFPNLFQNHTGIIDAWLPLGTTTRPPKSWHQDNFCLPISLEIFLPLWNILSPEVLASCFTLFRVGPKYFKYKNQSLYPWMGLSFLSENWTNYKDRKLHISVSHYAHYYADYQH